MRRVHGEQGDPRGDDVMLGGASSILTSGAEVPMASNPPRGYPRICPYLNYEDTGAMVDWLGRAFGLVERQYVYIDDLDAHCERAREAGAEIIEEPHDAPYGDRRYGAKDPEGHRWYFASRLSRSS